MTNTFKTALYILSLSFATISFGSITQAQPVANATRYSGLGEKIWLQTDKPSYLAGEMLWYQIVYRSTHVSNSAVAYVELLTRDGKPVEQTLIDINKRGGSGSFYLPASLPTDRYILRAYTRWMRNAGNNQYFETPITVVNTVMAGASRIAALASPRIEFYPESVAATVAFKINDSYGEPIAATGVLVNAQGDSILNFSTNHLGTGRLQITPEENTLYTARVQIGNQTITQTLPKASNRGYTLKAETNGTVWKVTILAKGLSSGSERLKLVAHDNSRELFAQEITVNNNLETTINIPLSALQEGVNVLTLLNQQKAILCDRLLFNRPVSQKQPVLETVKSKYGQREPVTISLAAPQTLFTGSDSVQYSVSVYQMAPWETSQEAGMLSQLYLLPYLRENISNPDYYFGNNANIAQDADNLMLVNGRREGTATPSKSSKAEYLPELKGHLVTARVVRKSDNSPVPGEIVYLTAPGFPYDLESGKTDRQGYIYFEVDNYYGPGELVAKLVTDSANFFRVELHTPFAEDALKKTYSSLSPLKKEWADYLENRSVAVQAHALYLADSIRKFSVPAQLDTIPFYGKPEFSYKLDEYKRFTTMEEVLREYVAPIGVSIRGGKHYMTIYDLLNKINYSDNVMVLIDGIPLTEHNKIFAYDPLKVKKLDVVTRRFVMGATNVAGIASFETYAGRFDAFEIDPSVMMINYDGMQLHRTFFSPDYKRKNNLRIPDLRNTLYWQPNITQSTKDKVTLQFYTGDVKGAFRVVVNGISDAGDVFTTEKTIVVE